MRAARLKGKHRPRQKEENKTMKEKNGSVKDLVKDEKGRLMQLREILVEEIDSAWMNLQSSFEQLRRQHYHRLGELFIQLRLTFQKDKKGDREFGAFCKKHWPKIKDTARKEYIAYRKGLGPVTSASREADLPPLRHVTAPNVSQTNRPGDQYRRIVDHEVKEPESFHVPSTKREQENELILDLAEKIINAGFRVLSVKLHPDKDGGSNEAQRRLNAAKKLLQDALAREELRR
jgi:hypothetical protein